MPSKWDSIKNRFNDVYVLVGSLTRSMVFNRVNISDAFAVILLASGVASPSAEEENIDSDILFAYLKLEQYIPRDVFFSVELTCSANVAVLNATIMKRARVKPDEYFSTARTSEIHRKKDDGTVITTPKPVIQMQPSLDPYLKSPNLPSVSENGTPSNRKDSGDDDELNRLTKNRVAGNEIVKTETGDHLGRFTSKRSTLRQTVNNPTLARLPTNIGRRATTLDIPTIEMIQVKEPTVVEESNEESRFWDATDTHHMLPVFASARAYVPSSFESLLVQSFFGVLTPLICEKLVCGQAGQIVLQADVPKKMIGRKFLDLFRALSKHHVICFGLYRAPSIHMRAILPYVYICPPPASILAKYDKIFVFGKPSRLARALLYIEHHE
mmetsp:Transcript_12619/g.13030  ORF Transcript_12619/g.13030 Transcript_12619/m.13030 type:complete len:383 (+) Transcript_12619:2-1150(+)